MKPAHVSRFGKAAAGLALGTAVLLSAACGSSGKTSALRSYLEKGSAVRMSPLPPHATTISVREAKKIASSTDWHWLTPPGKTPRLSSAGLWKVTDPGLYIPEHGIRRLLVHNQVAWIVLVHGVNIAGAPTPSGATGANGPAGGAPQWKPVYGTAVVAINAESGKRVLWWTLPRRGA